MCCNKTNCVSVEYALMYLVRHSFYVDKWMEFSMKAFTNAGKM